MKAKVNILANPHPYIFDQGEFEAMKTLSGRRAPHCDKHQFRATMTVST